MSDTTDAPAPAEPVDNTALALPDPAPEPAPEPVEAAEPDPAPETEPKPDEPKPDDPPWFRKRLGDMSRKLADEARARQLAERRLAELSQPQQQPDPAQPQPERRYTQAELDQVANQRAEQIAAQTLQQQAVSRVLEAGAQEYTPTVFNAACNTLADLGASDKPEFLGLVAELPNGHALLHDLGNNPDQAYRILNLPPARMALELGRMSAALAIPKPAPVAKAVSQAPAPITPVRGTGSVVENDPDKMSMEAYVKYRAGQQSDARGKSLYGARVK